jgi:hypothetical protein
VLLRLAAPCTPRLQLNAFPEYAAVALLSLKVGNGHINTTTPRSPPISWVWDSGLIAVSCAALVFSLGSLAAKVATTAIPLLEVVAVRSVISLTIVGATIWWRGIRPVIGARANLKLLAARGLCGCTAMTLYYIGLSKLSLGEAVRFFCLLTFSHAAVHSDVTPVMWLCRLRRGVAIH